MHLGYAVLVQALEIAVFFSELTPFTYQSLLAYIPPLPDTFLLPIVANSSQLERSSNWPGVVLDYGYSPKLSLWLLETAQDSLVIGMYADCPDPEVRGKADAETMAEAVAAYLQTLNFTQVFLATTATPFYQHLGLHLQTRSLVANTVNVRQNQSLTEAEMLVGRILKPSGSPMAVILVDEDTGTHLISALNSFFLMKKGYAYLFSEEAVWASQPSGVLYVTDSAAVQATSRVQFEGLVLADLLRHLASGQARPISFSLVNIVNGKPSVVATTPLTLLGTLQLPGNVTQVPGLHRPVIEVSVDFTVRNFDGSSYASALPMSIGAALAYAEANRRSDIISGHQFLNNSVSFAGSVFNATWARSQVNKFREKIGVAFHSFGFTAVAMGIANLFQSMKVIVPITTSVSSPLISDPETYPMILRTTSSASTLVAAQFIKLFGWKRVVVISSDLIGDVAMIKSLVLYVEQYGIEVVNSEENRVVPANLVNNTQQLNVTLQEILTSTVRILVIAHVSAHYIFDEMYAMGARAGDFMICVFYGLSPSYFTGTDEISLHRRLVAKGAMVFFDRYFSGTEGPAVKKEAQRLFGANFTTAVCLMYDNAMLAAHSIGYMLTRGLLFEDGLQLIREMRKIRFNGCLGIIQIEPGTNERRAGYYSVQNYHLEGTNQTFNVVEAATYSPYNTQLFTLLPVLQFPDGSNSTFPDSWLLQSGCPYLVKDIRSFPQGVTLGIAVNFGFAGLSGVAVLATYRLWRNEIPGMLMEKHRLSWEDSLALLSLPLEFVQLLALAPDLYLQVTRLERLSLLHVEEFVNVSRGAFWVVEIVVLLWVLVSTVQSGVQFLGLCRTDSCHWLWNLIQPALHNALFLPTCLTLMSTFECQQATGPSFPDSFLDRDCYETCWTGTHLIFVVVSAVSLSCYLPLAFITRPRWQTLRPNLHVKANSPDLMLKSVLQTTLVAAFVSLQQTYPLVHATVYLAILTLYTLMVWLTKGYNYERFNLWRRVLLLALLCYAGLGLARASGTEPPNSLIIWACVCAVLLAAGFLAQIVFHRFRSLLVREKEDRYDIIKFAFTYGEQAQLHLRNFLEKRAAAQYSQPVTSQGMPLTSTEVQ